MIPAEGSVGHPVKAEVRRADAPFVKAGVALLLLGLIGTLLLATPAAADEPWWNSDYEMRFPIRVQVGTDSIASGYSIPVDLPHAAMVTAGHPFRGGATFVSSTGTVRVGPNSTASSTYGPGGTCRSPASGSAHRQQ